MSTFDELDVTPQAMLRGQVGLQLSHRQIRHLHRQFGLRLPLRIGAAVDGPPTVAELDALTRTGVLDGGAPSAWFLPLWATITAPSVLVVLERVAGDDRHVWTFSVHGGIFAEQADLPDGMVWLFGPNLELLPRLALDAGLLRTIDHGHDGVLDPLPHATAWTVGVDVFRRGNPAQQALVSMRLRTSDGEWFDEQSADEPLRPQDVVERLASDLQALAIR